MVRGDGIAGFNRGLGIYPPPGGCASRDCVPHRSPVQCTIEDCAKLGLECFYFSTMLVPAKRRMETLAMAVALEINFALWIMIGCIAMKVMDLIGYLN